MSDTHPQQPTAHLVESSPRHQPKRPDPCAMVIFGAGGDLTRRLLVPALYNLSCTGLIPDRFAIIGVTSPRLDADTWRDRPPRDAAKLRRQCRQREPDRPN